MYDTCPVCGHLTADLEKSKRYHQLKGDPMPIEQDGANDVPPLPERE